MPIGSKIWWHDAHVGLMRCASIVCRIVGGLALPVVSTGLLLERGHVGRRLRRLDAEERLQEPLAARHRRRAAAADVTVISAPLPSSPRRMSSSGRQRHAAELRAVDVRDSVVLRQPLVDERVVRLQQIEDAAVFLDDAGEEQFGLALERVAQVVVEIREQIHDRLGWSSARAHSATGR